jgi:hypothetical protein
MLELYIYFLYYLKRKNLDRIKDIIKYLKKLSNKLLVY